MTSLRTIHKLLKDLDDKEAAARKLLGQLAAQRATVMRDLDRLATAEEVRNELKEHD